MLGRIVSFLRGASSEPPKIEILSKEDARTAFAMTREQWNENVRRGLEAGVCHASGNPETGLSMLTLTSQGYILGVRPSYDTVSARPVSIQVSASYRDPVPAQVTDAVLRDAIDAAKIQMRPEFDVTGNVDRFRGGVSVYFSITEVA